MRGSLSSFMPSCSDTAHPGSTAVDGSPNERTRFALLTNFLGHFVSYIY